MNIKRIVIYVLCLVMTTPLWGQAKEKKYHLVGTNDCGVESAQPFLVKGENFRFSDMAGVDEKALTCNFGGRVIYAFDQVDIEADYRMEVVYLSDGERIQSVTADGNPIQEKVVLQSGVPQRFMVDLPRKSYAYGQLVLVFEVLKGANTVVSEVNIYSTRPQKLIPFTGEKKIALGNVQAYTVDTTVSAETVLPQYTPVPVSMAGVYQPEISLDGVWQFAEKPLPGSGQYPAATKDWKDIVVPGQWSMQGFKVDSAGFGVYRRNFRIPEDWNGQRVKLRFDAVASECVVFVNGRETVKHLGGMTAFETDVTECLKTGENELLLLVRSESLADMLGSLTQYAAHQLGGITRKVRIFAVPATYVSDLRITTDLDSHYKDAVLNVFAEVKNDAKESVKGGVLRVSAEGLPGMAEQLLPELKAGESWSGWLKIEVRNPLKWNPEHPTLYTLRVEMSRDGKITEQIKKRFGFREIEMAGNRVLVNGVAVKLRGVCRHEAHPLTGRVLTTELRRRDAELYRAANCNFIRTSHYPPGEEFMEACDELGLFVEVEAPVCWVGHHANLNWKELFYKDKKYYPYVLQANMETVHFYRNHPSVLFWSVANESYWNSEFAQVAEYVKKADPTRPFAFHDQAYGGFNNQGSTAPIANIHYPGPNGYKQAAKSERPMVYGEYCHLNVYNRSELVTDPGVRSDWALALAPAWENMYTTPAVLGGSIWSGIDDIFQLPDGNAVGYGAWGPIDGWRRAKPEYWDMKKIYSPVRVHTRKLEPAGVFELEVENRYLYTNFNELRVTWSYGTESGRIFTDLAPGQRGKMVVKVANPQAANELCVTFYDPRGFAADEYVIPVGRQPQNELPPLPRKATRLKEKSDRYVISGEAFVCEISKQTGRILSVKRNHRECISGGPFLMVLPLVGGGCLPNHNANTPIFNDVCADWTVTGISAVKTGEDVEVKVAGKYKDFDGAYSIRVNAGGELSVDYSFKSLAAVNPRQWGMVFETPVGFDKLFWRRDGLWSVYPADHISRPVGEASLFYEGVPRQVDPRTEPLWAWSMDCNELGSNDFRATRRNVWFAGLKNTEGAGVTALSGGKQHWRSWLENGKIRFLVADFVTAGDEMFLGSYYAPFRKPLNVGSVINGEVKLRVE